MKMLKWLAGALGAVGGASPLSASSGASVGYSPVRPGRAIAAHAPRGPSAAVAPFVLLALCLLASPASAQLQGTCTLVSSGNYFVIRVNGDSIARHDTEVTMAARVLSEHLKRPGAAVTATRVQTVRPGGCLVAPGRVDTLSIVRVDTLYRRDTLTVVRMDTLRFRDTVFVPVTPPPPPPVDTVIVTPPPPPPPAPVDTTPALTGYWSPQWKATYSRMRAENHVWWQLISTNCAGNRYGDVGLWCAIVYKTTGDTVAAKKGATTWLAANPQTASDNHRRENFIEGCVMYDALRPALTAAQDSTWRGRLNAWASQSLATRPDDGDLTIGVTLAMQCLDRVTGTAWAARVPALVTKVQWYIDHFQGGELDESMYYNAGTSVFLTMGLMALPAGTYQHADTFLRDHAKYLPFSVTPDRKQYVQWGDDQNPRDFTARLFKKMTDWMVTQGVTRDASLQELITSVVTQYGARGYLSAEPWGRAFLFYDPYAPVGAVAYGRHVSTGRGHLYTKTPTTTVFLVASNKTFEDHEWHWTFNAEVYRNGEWALTMPRSYGLWPAYQGEGPNGISLAGLGDMSERGWTRVDSGSVAGAPWSAITGFTKGPLYAGGYYDPPPAYVRYAGRTALTTEVDGWTVIVTRDTVDMDDPRTLPKFARYRTTDPWRHQQWITASEGLPWTVWHSRVAPTITGNSLTWQTAGGQTVAIDALTDGTLRSVVVDEATVGTLLVPSENKFYTKLTTDAKVLWSVVRIGTGTPPAVTRVGDTVTVGSRTITITTAGVVVNAIP